MCIIPQAHDTIVPSPKMPRDFEETGGVRLQVIARANATPDELKMLGTAITTFRDWARYQTGRRPIILRDSPEPQSPSTAILPLALCDLLDGHYPSRLLAFSVGLRNLSPRPQSLPPGASTEAKLWSIRQAMMPGVPYCRCELIETLHEFLPSRLVKDVLIDGRTWEDLED